MLRSECDTYLAQKSNIDALSDCEAMNHLERVSNTSIDTAVIVKFIERVVPIGIAAICRRGLQGSMPNKVSETVYVFVSLWAIIPIGAE